MRLRLRLRMQRAWGRMKDEKTRKTCQGPKDLAESGGSTFFSNPFLKGVFVLLLHAVFIGPVAQRIEQQSSKL